MTATGIQSERLLKAREVAELMSVTEMTIYNLTTANKLPSFKIGRARRYRIEDVRDYMSRNYQPAGEVTT